MKKERKKKKKKRKRPPMVDLRRHETILQSCSPYSAGINSPLAIAVNIRTSRSPYSDRFFLVVILFFFFGCASLLS